MLPFGKGVQLAVAAFVPSRSPKGVARQAQIVAIIVGRQAETGGSVGLVVVCDAGGEFVIVAERFVGSGEQQDIAAFVVGAEAAVAFQYADYAPADAVVCAQYAGHVGAAAHLAPTVGLCFKFGQRLGSRSL